MTDHIDLPATRSCGCPDYDEARLALSRRAFLGGTVLAGGAIALGPGLSGSGPRAYAVTNRPASRLANPFGSVLVLLSLRGAADGLSLVVPHADPNYYAARPRIGIPHTALLAPDAMFGLHPCLLYTSPSPRDGLLSRMPSSA